MDRFFTVLNWHMLWTGPLATMEMRVQRPMNARVGFVKEEKKSFAHLWVNVFLKHNVTPLQVAVSLQLSV